MRNWKSDVREWCHFNLYGDDDNFVCFLGLMIGNVFCFLFLDTTIAFIDDCDCVSLWLSFLSSSLLPVVLILDKPKVDGNFASDDDSDDDNDDNKLYLLVATFVVADDEFTVLPTFLEEFALAPIGVIVKKNKNCDNTMKKVRRSFFLILASVQIGSNFLLLPYYI